MKNTGQQRKTSPPPFTKSKLGSGISQAKLRISDAKASKRSRKKTGKSSIELCGLPLPCPTQPLNQQMQAASTSFQKITPGNSLIVPGQRPQQFGKLKLQLFPLDEVTRVLLEKGNYNPYLELTLGIRKKIASVVKHLNTKWINSIPTSGELMLFPYEVCLENMSDHRRWTGKDFSVCASDVYAAVGSPAVFRLRYAWISDTEPGHHGTSLSGPQFKINLQSEQNQRINITDDKGEQCLVSRQESGPEGSFDQGAGRTTAKSVDMSISRITNNVGPSFVDSFSNISIGALLSEVVTTPDANQSQLISQNNSNVQNVLINFDSFDAAIAAHIARYQPADPSAKQASQPIWEAEETCHAFPFQKNTRNQTAMDQCNDVPFTTCLNISSNSIRPDDKTDSVAQAKPLQFNDGGAAHDLKTDFHPQTEGFPCKEPTTGLNPHLEIPCHAKNDFERIDNYWPESRGSLLNGSNSSKLMISDDSISISNLLASSLDAFQNWSLL
ncbi:hypothetical protein J5N97_013313 [Dioscorea zingiberensis]|uniref:TSL-kinase interacting protein 1 n=1 Tax=Dioscorea zingiberensis TaxID=325984 RepID=A0A9D5HIN0_9LILI|nr:hypothetical protein J5N97_013313 [Dioscorea zingiberensis]